MDAVEFVKARRRMLKQTCRATDLYNDYINPEEVVSETEKWSAEHPHKTRQSEFLKQWPNAKCVGNILTICPKVIDMNFSCPAYSTVDIDCPDCRRKFWMQEVK